MITLTDSKHRFSYDVEVPIDLAVDKLLDDIVQSLNGFNPALYIDPFSVELFNQRMKKTILEDQTLSDAGVRNGDYILIQKKGK